MKIDKKKIVLGTAQFFSSYGIVNENKKQTKKHFYEILELAGKNDIFLVMILLQVINLRNF